MYLFSTVRNCTAYYRRRIHPRLAEHNLPVLELSKTCAINAKARLLPPFYRILFIYLKIRGKSRNTMVTGTCFPEPDFRFETRFEAVGTIPAFSQPSPPPHSKNLPNAGDTPASRHKNKIRRVGRAKRNPPEPMNRPGGWWVSLRSTHPTKNTEDARISTLRAKRRISTN